MSLTAITVTFTFATTAGGAAVGTVRFTPAVPYTDGTIIDEQIAQTITLSSGGGSCVLYVEGNTTQFVVTQDIVGSPPHTYTITVPANAPGGTVALGSLLS